MPSAVVTRSFPLHIRERGADLAHAGAVLQIRTRDDFAIATVRGTLDYSVTIRLKGRTATLACSCPYASGGAFCKHQWAVLLLLPADPRHARFVEQLERMTSVQLDVPFTMHPDAGAGDEAAPETDEASRTPDAPLMHDHAAPPGLPAWQVVLDRAAWQMRADTQARTDGPQRPARAEWPADRRIVYVLDTSIPSAGGLTLEVATERRDRDGTWGDPKRFGYATDVWFAAPEAEDRAIARLLLGAAPLPDYGHARSSFVIPPATFDTLLPRLGATGRLRVKFPGTPPVWRAVRWDDGRDATGVSTPWRFTLAIEPDTDAGHRLTGTLVRGNERCPMAAVLLLHQGGLCLIGDALAPLEMDGQWPLMSELLAAPSLPIGPDPAPALARLYALPRVPVLALPDGLHVVESHVRPTVGVRFVADPLPWRRYGTPMAGVQLAFRYGRLTVDSTDPGTTRFCADSKTLYHRDPEVERAARDRLLTLGASTVREPGAVGAPFVLPRSQLLRIAQLLTREGWWVEADGRAFHLPAGVRANVRSGVDWFDLAGTVDYGTTSASLRDVLDARRRGADVVELADGSYGMLPHDWLDRLGPVLAGGTPTEGGARFRSSQLALLDALLATLPDIDVDAQFAQAREALAGFDRIVPADPPPSFTGTLRGYQRDGLGWLHFLRTFGFGGCLADDMGLGKTIQVLALLDARRVEGHGPSLVVVPRSLVFNWRAEAERFAPQLRTADWSGAARLEAGFDASGVDVVFVTYGTLRRDAAELASIPFDYVVLDEAQAIKNRGTATAKACRLLTAKHRLALSGTPVENRLDELWSLLDFLNPGMLGTSARFSKSLHDLSAESGAGDVLARALRPVILRRTKAQVAPDLPERIERTLEVELEPKQRAFYDQLHARVRADVLQQVDAKGLGRSRMHILEGLLRLRQAACHPVLADARRRTLPSAKLEALVPALADVAAEGNKALVFSQFTEFLALVRAALDEEKIPYEYLDGRTKDRQARVERFQGDPSVPVFLISLKAGGHGLNLTAADYVYLLDPWWNPAVEAQAIDRAHRIGRTRRVIATRLVARDTIEEKILALQASKRALADAILTADRGGLASIGREELELLLG